MRLPGLGASMGCNNLGKRVSGANAGFDNAGGNDGEQFRRIGAEYGRIRVVWENGGAGQE